MIDFHYERRVTLLLNRLPTRIRTLVEHVRQPQQKLLRYFVGGLFLIGGCLFFLPILGVWMLPLGMILLADDVPVFKRLAGKILEWVERKHPKWLGIE